MRYLLHDVFLEAVGKLPEKIAIKEECGKDLTYRELNNLSNKFAQSILPYKKDVKNFEVITRKTPLAGSESYKKLE